MKFELCVVETLHKQNYFVRLEIGRKVWAAKRIRVISGE